MSAQGHNNFVSFFGVVECIAPAPAVSYVSLPHQFQWRRLRFRLQEFVWHLLQRSQVFSLRSPRCSSDVMTLTAAVDLCDSFCRAMCHRFANASALAQGPLEYKCTHLTIHTHDSSHRRRGGGSRGRVVVGGEEAKGKGILSGIGFFGCRV